MTSFPSTETPVQLDPSLPQVTAFFGRAKTERLRVWLKNLRVIHIRVAYAILRRAIRSDKSYRDSWQANIAMPIYDSLSSGNHEWKHIAANRIADRLMRHLFDA